MVFEEVPSETWFSANMHWVIPAVIGFFTLLFGVWKYFFPRVGIGEVSQEKTIEDGKKRTNILFIDCLLYTSPSPRD